MQACHLPMYASIPKRNMITSASENAEIPRESGQGISTNLMCHRLMRIKSSIPLNRLFAKGEKYWFDFHFQQRTRLWGLSMFRQKRNEPRHYAQMVSGKPDWETNAVPKIQKASETCTDTGRTRIWTFLKICLSRPYTSARTFGKHETEIVAAILMAKCTW